MRALTIARYLGAGFANTLLTYALYLMLLDRLGAVIAFSTSFFAGIGLTYLLQRFFVFRSRGAPTTPLVVLVTCLLQYAAGVWLVHVFVQSLGGPPVLAPAFALCFTVPAGFAISAWAFRSRPVNHSRPLP